MATLQVSMCGIKVGLMSCKYPDTEVIGPGARARPHDRKTGRRVRGASVNINVNVPNAHAQSGCDQKKSPRSCASHFPPQKLRRKV